MSSDEAEALVTDPTHTISDIHSGPIDSTDDHVTNSQDEIKSKHGSPKKKNGSPKKKKASKKSSSKKAVPEEDASPVSEDADPVLSDEEAEQLKKFLESHEHPIPEQVLDDIHEVPVAPINLNQDEVEPEKAKRMKLFDRQKQEIREKGWFTVYKNEDGVYIDPDTVIPENAHLFEKEEWEMGWLLQVGQEKINAVGPNARKNGKQLFKLAGDALLPGKKMSGDGRSYLNVWHGLWRILKHHGDLVDRSVGLPHITFRKPEKKPVADVEIESVAPPDDDVSDTSDLDLNETPQPLSSANSDHDDHPVADEGLGIVVHIPGTTDLETTLVDQQSSHGDDEEHDEEQISEVPMKNPSAPFEVASNSSEDTETAEPQEPKKEPFMKADRRFRWAIPIGSKKEDDGEKTTKTLVFHTSTKIPGWRLRNICARTVVAGSWMCYKVLVQKVIAGWLGFKVPVAIAKWMWKIHKDLKKHFDEANDKTQQFLNKIDSDFEEARQHSDEGMFGSKMSTFLQAVRLYFLKGVIGTPFYHFGQQFALTFGDNAKLFFGLMGFVIGAVWAVHNSAWAITMMPVAYQIAHLYAIMSHWASMSIFDFDTHNWKTQTGINWHIGDPEEAEGIEGKDGLLRSVKTADAWPLVRLPFWTIPIKGVGQATVAPIWGACTAIGGALFYAGPVLVCRPRQIYDSTIYHTLLSGAKIPNKPAKGLYFRRAVVPADLNHNPAPQQKPIIMNPIDIALDILDPDPEIKKDLKELMEAD